VRLQLQRVELAPLVDQLLAAYAPLAKPGVVLGSSVPPGAAVLADPSRLRQALCHLLDNACQFTLQGTVQVAAAPAAAEGQGSPPDGSDCEVAISVTDTGVGSQASCPAPAASAQRPACGACLACVLGPARADPPPPFTPSSQASCPPPPAQVGIPAAQLPHVWGRFMQGAMGPARQHCGAGLGLYLVRGLVQAQGGRVQLSSQEGHGTSVALALPAWDNATSPGLVAQQQLQQAQQLQQELQDARQQQGAPGGGGAAGAAEPAPAEPAAQAGARLRVNSSTQSLAALLASATSAAAAEQPQVQTQTQTQQQPQPTAGVHSPPHGGALPPGISKPCHRERHGSVQMLCVDDDPISQLVVKRLLGPAGARGGRAAPLCRRGRSPPGSSTVPPPLPPPPP
jgi:hypothetical protein